MTNAVVKSLFIYPLKSAKGISVSQLLIDESGPLFDREWMLVKRGTKSFISQRTHPIMGQLECQLDEKDLKISQPNGDFVSLPLAERSGQFSEVSLFNKPVMAETVGPIADEWFSEFLKTEVIAVRVPSSNSRTTSGRHGPETRIRFPDGYPFLMTNVATLDQLNQRLSQPITMSRFRPNILIEGPIAEAEDSWSAFDIGEVSFLAVKACSRCAIIDIDPISGKKSNLVSTELKKYRQKENQILFGMNLSHISEGTISVGTSLSNIKETKPAE